MHKTATMSDGFVLHYEDDDFTDPWKPQSVVLLQHGLAASAALWRPWVPPIAGRHRVIRVDGRGWGNSKVDDVASITFDRYVQDLHELILGIGVGAVHYCGQSLGGPMGIGLAARHPEVVKTLTLVAAPTAIPAAAKRNFAYGHTDQIEAMQKMGAEGWVRAAESFLFPKDVDPGLREWYYTESGKSDLNVMIQMARLIEAGLDSEPFLKDVRCPVLVLHPEGGHVANSDQRKILMDRVKDIRVQLMPGGHHAIANLYPRECTQALLDFIESH